MSTPIAPGLVILHSNRLETLRDTAIEWGRRYPLAPLENDVFLVQSNGMAQWLKLAFASKDALGICAAHQFLMPSRFLWQAYRKVLGPTAVPATSPFDESRLVWRMYRWLSQVLPGMAEGSEDAKIYAPLQRYLKDNRDAGKCFGLAQKLADLFDQYQVYRADWLNAWQAGNDIVPGQVTANGVGGLPGVPDAQRWQPALWRALIEELPATQRLNGRSHVHQGFIETLRDPRYRPSGLPRRLQVFGLSSMPTQMLEAIDALSRHVQVLVYVVNPCQHYWADILDGSEMLGITRHRHARKPGLPALLPLEQLAVKTNPLLAAWGKQGRDFIGLLYRYDSAESSRADIDLFHSPLEDSAPTLLKRVQHAIFDLQPLPDISGQSEGEGEPEIVTADDRSLQFHLCHSRQREVEVLHDRLLDLFERHPDLQPRDVIVMAPDIDRYAAHVEAVFGNVSTTDARYIPFTLADRPERACHPMAMALETLLRLPDMRFTVSDLLGLLEVAAVRERFGITEQDLPVLQRWMVQSGIRWGLTAAQRETLDLPADLHGNTWKFGLRRVLLGYACGRGEAWCGVEPFGSVAGLEGVLAGRLLQAIDALEMTWQHWQQSQPLDRWCEQLQEMLTRFFLPQDDADEFLLLRFENAIDEWRAACLEGGVTVELLPLVVVRESMLVALDGEGLSQRFLAGCVNFCTLMPMRSIPFNVVCLLGMNDGEYPRHRVPMDFDLMNGRYRPGDRSRREDDRYLFLEALLSARELFYISYIGRSIRDDSERPPSVLVAQLRDYLSAVFRCENGEDIATALTLAHPLQPFSLQYFTGKTQWFTYASEWRDVHQPPQAVVQNQALAAFVREEPLMMDELYRFLRQPVTYFFEQRLKVRFLKPEEHDIDCETFALDGLDQYQLGQDLVEKRRLNKTSFNATVERWRREGRLPAGAWGDLAVAPVVTGAESLWQALEDFSARFPTLEEAFEIRLEGEGLRVEDWVSGVCRGPTGLALLDWRATASRGGGSSGVKYHYFLSPWVKQVCLAASGVQVQTVFLAPDHVYTPPVLTQAQAIVQLTQWLAAWRQGMLEPLPVAFKSALAFLRTLQNGKGDPWQKADATYASAGMYSSAERDENPALARSYASVQDMTGFDQWAERLYGGLFHWIGQEANG